MKTNLILTDDFYPYPQKIRDFALNQEFKVRGNFPGQRTEPFPDAIAKENIQKIIFNAGGKVTDWGGLYTGAFQYTTKRDKSWVHVDPHNGWACVCYLTPNAPPSSGTGIFRHKETGLSREPQDINLAKKLESEGNDLSKWELSEVLSNSFNRIVMYRGDFYHRSLDYFGEDKFTGRLFQTFFINTEH